MSPSDHANCPWCRTNEWLELRENMIRLWWIRCELCACEGPLKESQDEAWAAWDAWNKGEWVYKPTEAGWWWYKSRLNSSVSIVYIASLGSFAASRWRDDDFTWQGPIKPKE